MSLRCSRPDIFTYLDFRLYLKDFLQFLRQRNPAFRFQTLVEKYGLNSRAHYIDIMKGRKLTEAFIEPYLKICELQGDPARYFRAIVGYGQSETEKEKTAFFGEIITLSPNLETVKLEQEAYRYFSRWYYPAMLSLLDIHKNENDHRKLAKLFKPGISAIQAKRAIRLLVELGFIFWDEAAGLWTFPHKFFKCTEGARATALREFHRNMLEAGRASYENDYNAQNFSTLTLSTSIDTKKEIERMIVDFRTTIMEKVKVDSKPEVVIQMNMQLFELSKALRWKKKDTAGL